MAHKELHGLNDSIFSPTAIFFESNSEDLARIIPGLLYTVGILDTDAVEDITWLLQFLSNPFGMLGLLLADTISLQDTLLNVRGSPIFFVSVTIVGLGGKASDKQPF